MAFANYNDWVTFTQEGRTPAVRAPILDSWKRSRQSGLSPHMYPIKKTCPVIAPSDEFSGQINNLLNFLLKLVDNTTRLGIIVCGNAGEIIDIPTTEPTIAELLDSLGLRKGVILSEESAGTNAVSLAMMHKGAIICYGAEHYLHKLHSLGGVAVPVYDIDGAPKGFIALYCVLPEMNVKILKSLLVLLIYFFDQQTRLQRSKALHDQLKQQITCIFKDDQKAMLMVTPDGYLRQINPAAIKLLEITEKQRDEKSPDSLAAFTPPIREIARCAIPCRDIALEIRLSRKRLQIMCERLPLFSDRDEFLGSLLVFHEQTVKHSSKEIPKARFNFADILGNSPLLKHAKELALKAAETSVNVFLHGPSGTGKEMFAHSIHNASDRKEYPFVAINCAAIPREIAESEFFGYAPGAFTGARKDGNIGRLEAADKGTIFLDEIGDMPIELQAKLLRLLESRTITRIGDSRERPINIRIIAASNRNIPDLVETGKFREDLYYRLNVISVSLPPLSDCREDIPVLAESFIRHFNEIMGKKVPGIKDEIMEHFKSYSWPGNIRELKNAIEFAVMLNSGADAIAWKDLPGKLRADLLYREISAPPGDPFGQERREIQNSEKALYEKAVVLSHNNLSKAAKYLKISRSTLYRKLKIFEIPY
ncbi:MAG: sigma 54-interacting transcriptional regulator [Victivallaceae bacterium]|nr:sigma 54-interacting transcriptional regulator [Victivallaceae bacterium]